MRITAGFSGVARHGCVALTDGTELLAICEQERASRVRGAGFNSSGLPDEALDVMLERVGTSRADIDRYVLVDAEGPRSGLPRFERVDRHRAHACASYLSSPFMSAAAIVVCDDEAPAVSVWIGEDATVRRVEWTWHGLGFAEAYRRCARAFGFQTEQGEQRFEALARLYPDHRDGRVERLVTGDEQSVTLDSSLEADLEGLLSGEDLRGRAALATAVQARMADVFVGFLREVQRRTGCDRLCLAGTLFYHSSINAAVNRAGIFREVFVPVDPGNGGLAVGAAVETWQGRSRPMSPFLGPAYSTYETKETLDNCKLGYGFESEDSSIAVAVSALQRGTLVAWFDGAMEWGRRALGGRCILANPLSPYVLENLNRFLKRREPWRGYALSGLEESIHDHFDGPRTAPFMECDYRPRDAARLRHVLPSAEAAVRVQTVGRNGLCRFRRLLEAFEAATGLPFLVNTSFNGFYEPIVCSPRDAIRVFYGSGLDLLVINRFVLAK